MMGRGRGRHGRATATGGGAVPGTRANAHGQKLLDTRMRNIMPMQVLCNIVPITIKAGIEPHDEAGDPGRDRAAITGPGSVAAGSPGDGMLPAVLESIRVPSS